MSLLRSLISHAWRTLKGPEADAAEIAAGAIYPLIVDPARWIHRRVEFIEFLSDRAVRRHVSLDFTVPVEVGGVALDQGELPFVPLTLLKKKALRNFDLDDGQQNPVPILTKQQNEEYVGQSLVNVAETVLDSVLPPTLAVYLRALIGAEPPEAQRLLNEGPKDNEAKDAFSQLVANSEFVSYAEALASDFVLLAALPAQPGRRQLVKLAYDEELLYNEKWHRRVGVRLGWSEKRFLLFAPLGYSDSWHYETAAPQDLEVTTFQISLRLQNGEPGNRRDVPSRTRPHLFGSESGVGYLTIGLRARKDGFVRSSLMLTTLVFLILLGGIFHLSEISASEQTQTVAAVLLLAPTLLAAYAVRPGEHRLASSVFFGVRLLLATSALLPVIAIGLLAAGYGDCAYLVAFWFALLCGAAACMTMLAITYMRSAAVTPDRV